MASTFLSSPVPATACEGVILPSSVSYPQFIDQICLTSSVRGLVAIIWFGTQTYQTGECISSMISAIWPSFEHLPNHLPSSGPITSAQLLCFFLAIIVQLPLLYLNIPQLRYLFLVKMVIMPIFGLALFIWAVATAHGFGPVFSKPSQITDGTPVAVVFLQCVTSAIGPKATLALNMPDFTRYAHSPRQIIWTQALGLIVLVSLCGVLGATVTSASEIIYGVQTWNPLQVAALWDSRAAQFFAALCWSLAAVGTNLSANSVSFSNDLSLWFPRYINARRGAYVCAVLSILSCPWYIQEEYDIFPFKRSSLTFIQRGILLFLPRRLFSLPWVLSRYHYSGLLGHPETTAARSLSLRSTRYALFYAGIQPPRFCGLHLRDCTESAWSSECLWAEWRAGRRCVSIFAELVGQYSRFRRDVLGPLQSLAGSSG